MLPDAVESPLSIVFTDVRAALEKKTEKAVKTNPNTINAEVIVSEPATAGSARYQALKLCQLRGTTGNRAPLTTR